MKRKRIQNQQKSIVNVDDPLRVNIE